MLVFLNIHLDKVVMLEGCNKSSTVKNILKINSTKPLQFSFTVFRNYIIIII